MKMEDNQANINYKILKSCYYFTNIYFAYQLILKYGA